MSTPKIARFVPRDQKQLVVCLIALSAIDSVLVGYDSTLMGSLNVMPSYNSYFSLSTATKSLCTAMGYAGGVAMAPFAGILGDWRGRRECVMWAAIVTLVGGVIQGTAQNMAMFIAARCIIGAGMAIAQTTAPTLVAETAPLRYRGFALGMYWACWGVGTLIAAGVCFGTQNLASTFSWRIPSLLQVAPSIFCFVILQFVPESPRWLISRDRHDEALAVLAIINSDTPDQLQAQYTEIVENIALKKEQGHSALSVLCKKQNRRRLLIIVTFPAMVMLPGTNVITYYFGDILTRAGVTSPNTQLQINVILTSWSLLVAVVSSWYADAIGRKPLCAISLTLQLTFLFIFGGLTKLYGESTNTSGIYAAISMIFLHCAAHNWGITPLSALYPPEVLSIDIRSVGMGVHTCLIKCAGLLVTMAAPFGLQAIGWKFYMVNGCLDVLMVVFVLVVWVETRGLTLEEVDKVFDGAVPRCASETKSRMNSGK